MSRGILHLRADGSPDRRLGPAPVRGRKDALRVLMTTDAVGGVWRYAMGLAAALRAEGVTIVFAVIGPPPGLAQTREAEQLGTLVLLNESLDWMAESEHELETLPRTLEQIAARYAIDVVHLNLPSQAHGLNLEVPFLVTSHSCPITWWRAMRREPLPASWQWLRQRIASGLRRAPVVVAPSRSHADDLEQAYGPVPDLEVVHNAIAASVSGGAKENFIFAVARWWDEGKNGLVLDAAAASAPWPVVAAGPTAGPNGQRVDFRFARVPGEIPHNQVLDHMGRAAVFVSPSLYEPFGLAALEAARSRAALLLADIPTYRELWDGAAIFFDPRNPDALASAIDRLIAHPDLRHDLGVRAHARSGRFVPVRQAEEMTGLYRRLVSAASPIPVSMGG